MSLKIVSGGQSHVTLSSRDMCLKVLHNAGRLWLSQLFNVELRKYRKKQYEQIMNYRYIIVCVKNFWHCRDILENVFESFLRKIWESFGGIFFNCRTSILHIVNIVSDSLTVESHSAKLRVDCNQIFIRFRIVTLRS